MIRIVKMSFDPLKTALFLETFEHNKTKIRSFKGCNRLELYRDKQHSHIFFTYSFWASEKHLDQYRQSELFKSVWSKTKPLFNAPPQAWSVEAIDQLL